MLSAGRSRCAWRGKHREGGAGEGQQREFEWAKSARLPRARAFGVSSHSIDHPLSFFVDSLKYLKRLREFLRVFDRPYEAGTVRRLRSQGSRPPLADFTLGYFRSLPPERRAAGCAASNSRATMAATVSIAP